MDFNFNMNFNFGKKKEEPYTANLSFKEFAEAVHCKDKGFYDPYDFQIEMVEWTLKQPTDQTQLILATRGIGKTIMITCLSVLYRVYLNPKISIQIISDTSRKAESNIQYIGKIIKESPEFFKHIFNEREIQKTQINSTFNKGISPTIYTGSVDSTLRGKHPDIIVFDDILTLEKAHSRATRERAQIFYNEAKALTTNIIIVGNVAHPQDLHSILRTKEAVAKFELFNGDDRIPLSLQPDLNKLRNSGVTEATIQANYFGILIADESLPFYKVKTMPWDEIPKNVDNNSVSIFYDFSMGKNDTNAFALVYQYKNKLYVFGEVELSLWTDFIDNTAHYFNSLNIPICYESNTTGEVANQYFAKHGLSSIPFFTTANKRSKIAKLYPFIDDIILCKTDTLQNKAFIEQVKGYNPADLKTLDDAVDSLAMALNHLGIIDF